MTDKCDKCKQEIKDATEKRDGDIYWTVPSKDKIFHDECWNQIESEYRLDEKGKMNYAIKWTNPKGHNGVYSGTHEDHAYDWNQKRWRQFKLGDNPKDWGSPPNDNNTPERERESKFNNYELGLLN